MSEQKQTFRQLSVCDIKVIGGKLNPALGIPDCSSELKIAVLNSAGIIFIWQETEPQLCRCVFNINHPLTVAQMHLNMNEILFVTKDGGAFRGTLKQRKKKQNHDTENKTKQQHRAFSYFSEDNSVGVKITKIPHVYHGLSIQSDPNGENFVILQVSWLNM